MLDPDEMTYRNCVAIMMFNGNGEVWLGRRVPKWDTHLPVLPWQCPQGGIDPGESPEDAAYRELLEEVGCNDVSMLSESQNWHSYDLPPEAIGVALGGKYRGQRQKWFAARFLGDESEFNLIPPPPHKQEFDAWRWVPMEEVPPLVTDFKRPIYRAVLDEFRPVIARELNLASKPITDRG
jgi:putative (di)nucleoside polyphosphate hydrolase